MSTRLLTLLALLGLACPNTLLPRQKKQATQSESAPADTPKKKGRRRWGEQQKRRSSSTMKLNKHIDKMSYEELKESKKRRFASKDFESGLKFLEKMLRLCSDPNETHDLMLELAETYQTTDNFEKASILFHEFTKLYPGSAKTEYAYFKAIECSFKGTNDPERDQTKTKETIALTDAFLERATVFTTHAEQVRDIRAQCYERLFDSELKIFDFYTYRGMTTSAQKRLDNLRTTFIKDLPTAEPHILALESTFAEQQNNLQLATEKRTELATKFPDFELTKKEFEKTKHTKRVMARRF